MMTGLLLHYDAAVEDEYDESWQVLHVKTPSIITDQGV